MELKEFIKANKIKGVIFDMDGSLPIRWEDGMRFILP